MKFSEQYRTLFKEETSKEIEEGFSTLVNGYNQKDRTAGLAVLRPILKQIMSKAGYNVGEVTIDRIYRSRVHMVVSPKKYADIKYMSINIKWFGKDEVEVETYLKGMDREEADKLMHAIGGAFLGGVLAGMPDMRKTGKGKLDIILPQVADETVNEWQKNTKNEKYQMAISDKQAEIGAKYLAMLTSPVQLWRSNLKLNFSNAQEVDASWEKCSNFRMLFSKMD